ncbi:MAG: threonine--tRNA ligase [Candidatus Diapherotrites archaeon]|nr:threonine--tRNA ligase [Candidatus Diapherotrites archaeon]
MRIITMHSDFLEVEPKKKAIKIAEEVQKEKKRFEQCLVVFTGIEQGDMNLVEPAVNEIMDVCKQIHVNNVVIYPWVHLTSKPSRPEEAINVIKAMEQSLKEKGYVVHHAPFGWYKSFTIKVKGHPLAELSRIISKKTSESKALKAEKSLKSKWFILDVNGNLVDADKFDYKGYDNLKAFYNYEYSKNREAKEEPPHIRIMRAQELVDYEPASDPGHFRWYPKGKLMKGLLESFISDTLVSAGALEVETPIMYDYEHPALKKYLNRFPARQYTIDTPNKRVFLRFSACFGQFLMAHDATISYKNLPLWIYELTRYSFRVEQRGELSGLRRLRAFTMPDCHALCRDITQAKEQLMKRFKLSIDMQRKIGFDMPEDMELAIRITKDFWENNKTFVKDLVKEWGKPALIEMWDKRIFYFVMKYEFNFVDNLKKAAALTTDQIDVENAENYDISFVDSDGKKKRPIILHLSPTGAVERVIYALLEKAAKQMKKGSKAMLPLWIVPTQVRIIPVSQSFVNDALALLESIHFRVDVDDRDISLSKKIRDAEKEWIPFIVVYGEQEKSTGVLSVRVRGEGEKKMGADELNAIIEKKTKGMPFKPLPLPILLSKRPIFV